MSDIDELISLAKRAPKNKEVKRRPSDEIGLFVSEVHILDGNCRCPNYGLYRAYAMWSSDPLPKRSFYMYFSRNFPSKRETRRRVYQMYYLLNTKVWEIEHKVRALNEQKASQE